MKELNYSRITEIVYSYNRFKSPDFIGLQKLEDNENPRARPHYINYSTGKIVTLSRSYEYYWCACREYRTIEDIVNRTCSTTPLFRTESICQVKYSLINAAGLAYRDWERWRRTCWDELSARLALEQLNKKIKDNEEEERYWFDHHRLQVVEGLTNIPNPTVDNAPVFKQRGRPRTVQGIADEAYIKLRSLKNHLNTTKARQKEATQQLRKKLETDPTHLDYNLSARLQNLNNKVAELQQTITDLISTSEGKQLELTISRDTVRQFASQTDPVELLEEPTGG